MRYRTSLALGWGDSLCRLRALSRRRLGSPCLISLDPSTCLIRHQKICERSPTGATDCSNWRGTSRSRVNLWQRGGPAAGENCWKRLVRLRNDYSRSGAVRETANARSSPNSFHGRVPKRFVLKYTPRARLRHLLSGPQRDSRFVVKCCGQHLLGSNRQGAERRGRRTEDHVSALDVSGDIAETFGLEATPKFRHLDHVLAAYVDAAQESQIGFARCSTCGHVVQTGGLTRLDSPVATVAFGASVTLYSGLRAARIPSIVPGMGFRSQRRAAVSTPLQVLRLTLLVHEVAQSSMSSR